MLGCYGGVPGSEDACSSFVLESEKGNILVDCGSGVMRNLLTYTNLKDLKAVILSHLHFDHFNDLFALYYAFKVGISLGDLSKIKVYLPCSPIEVYNFIVTSMCDVFDFKDYTENDALKINDISINFCRTQHGIPTYAMRFEHGNYVVGYTSDTGYSEDVIDFLKGCDLLIAECSLLRTLPESKNHMNTEEVMKFALISNAKELILTHFWYSIPKLEYWNEVLQYGYYNENDMKVYLAKSGLKREEDEE